MATYPEFSLSQWRAEFTEKSSERAFRDSMANSSARDLRLALWTWFTLLVMITVYDLQTKGIPSGEYILLFTRTVLGAGLLLLIYRSHRNPDVAVAGYAVSMLEMLGFISLFLLLFIRPDNLVYTVVILILMLIAVFTVIPNRLIPATAAALFGIAGTLVSARVLGAGTETFWALVLALITPCAIGFLAARRLQTTQRQQFALLRSAQEANLQLCAEIERRKVLEDELKHQAMTDPLTGLYNRRHFEFLFKRERQRALRQNGSLSLCLVDLDYFKNVNDQHGHEVGDRVLQAAGQLFTRQLRQTDVTGRIGGEEFVLLLPDTTVTEAQVLIDRLRLTLADEPVQVGKLKVPVTATFAVTQVNVSTDNFDSVLRAADHALYLGKDAGRNCVMLASPA